MLEDSGGKHMQKWEYIFVKVPGRVDKIKIENQKIPVADYLQYLGNQGWEMVSATDSPVGGIYLFFKRPKTH
jgi:hypothetical protein